MLLTNPLITIPREYKSTSDRHEIGFLVALLLFGVFTFMIFYWAIPGLKNSISPVQAESSEPEVIGFREIVV